MYLLDWPSVKSATPRVAAILRLQRLWYSWPRFPDGFMTEIEQTVRLLKRGTDEILLEAELAERLKSGKRLRIKAGFRSHRARPASRPHGSY